MQDSAEPQPDTVFQVASRDDGSVLAVRATEDLDSSAEQRCRDELLPMCRGARARWLLLFLGDGRFVDRRGLDVLLDASEIARSHGRHLIIVGPPRCLTRLTDRLTLGATLCVAPTPSQAVQQIFPDANGRSSAAASRPARKSAAATVRASGRHRTRPPDAPKASAGRTTASTEDRFPDLRAWRLVMAAMLTSFTDAELAIARSTEPEALVDLDEEALLELHARVRRARNKYLRQYRRQAAAPVAKKAGPGTAPPQNQHVRDKVEVFETALARVSTALAKAARRSAADLRSERLGAASRTGRANRSRHARLPDRSPRAARSAPARHRVTQE